MNREDRAEYEKTAKRQAAKEREEELRRCKEKLRLERQAAKEKGSAAKEAARAWCHGDHAWSQGESSPTPAPGLQGEAGSLADPNPGRIPGDQPRETKLMLQAVAESAQQTGELRKFDKSITQ